MAPPAYQSLRQIASETITPEEPGFQEPLKLSSPRPSTSRMGAVEPFTVVDGPYAWKASDYQDQSKYIYVFSESDIAELDSAIAAVQGRGLDNKRHSMHEVTREDFPLPTLGTKLESFREAVRIGRGFQLFRYARGTDFDRALGHWYILREGAQSNSKNRGLPVERYTREQTMIAYWGIGTYWGKAQSNNKKGHLIGHIKDIGYDPSKPTTRLYATKEAQPWHNDSSDMVALLCLSNAKEGGLSGWSSSISVHNDIVRQRPDLARLLAGPWFMDRKGEVPEGKKGYFELPVFNYHQGYLSVNYSDNYYLLSQRFPEVARLTAAHYEAMSLFNQLASSQELALQMILQPGDIQLLNNHTCLHYRSAFVDWPEMDKKRHLLRLWVAPAVDRPLPDCYAELYGTTEVGNRGGIRVPGYDLNVPLEAE